MTPRERRRSADGDPDGAEVLRRMRDGGEDARRGRAAIKLSDIKIRYHKKTVLSLSLSLSFLQVFVIADVVHEVCDS